MARPAVEASKEAEEAPARKPCVRDLGEALLSGYH